MITHYDNDSANGEWLKLMADLESEESITPAQVVRTESVILDRATAKAIDLSGIYKMDLEEILAAMAPQEAA